MTVLGYRFPDPISSLLGTGYEKFRSPTGLNGLAKDSDERLDLLVVDATIPGTGQFRTFIEKAKLEYETICVWEVWNKDLRPILERYGFFPYHETDPDTDEPLEGYRWNGYDNRT